MWWLIVCDHHSHIELEFTAQSRVRSGPETPAPLKGLEGFLQVEERERGFKSRGFLWYDSSSTFLSGKAFVVNFWVWPLELKKRGCVTLTYRMKIWPHPAQELSGFSERDLHIDTFFDISFYNTSPIGAVQPYLFEPLLLVFGRKLFVCNQAFQQLVQGGLCSNHFLLLRLHLADLFTESWRRAEICIWSGVFDLREGTEETLQ